jgi:hypothetical protein
MSTWITVSRAVVGVIGAGALLMAGGNLLTGGGSITDPVMPGGVLLGLVAIGAAAWTTAPSTFRAAVVWLGVLGIGATLAILAAASVRLSSMRRSRRNQAIARRREPVTQNATRRRERRMSQASSTPAARASAASSSRASSDAAEAWSRPMTRLTPSSA